MNSSLVNKEETTRQFPGWYEEYRTSFLSSEAHAFILHKDIDGYAYELLSQRRFLVATLARTRSVIICYNIATGITFPDEAMRKEAVRLLGATGEDPASVEVDPLERALAGIGSPDSAPDDPFAVSKPFAALSVLEQLMRIPEAKGKVAVILDYADKLMPAMEKGVMPDDARKLLVLLQTWGTDRSLGNTNNPVFLLCRDLDDLHKDIRSRVSGYKAIEIPLPGYEER